MMAKRQHTLMVVLALIAGLIGGAVSSQFLGSAFAEKDVKIQKLVRANSFDLVDDKERLRGTFSAPDDTAQLIFF